LGVVVQRGGISIKRGENEGRVAGRSAGERRPVQGGRDRGGDPGGHLASHTETSRVDPQDAWRSNLADFDFASVFDAHGFEHLPSIKIEFIGVDRRPAAAGAEGEGAAFALSGRLVRSRDQGI
jgi:hypothetical protein